MGRLVIEQDAVDVLTDICNGATYYLDETPEGNWEFCNGSDVTDATGWGWAELNKPEDLRMVNSVLSALIDFYRKAQIRS
ncbi:hypothetical protein [Roseinatronobacter sp. S2]|uniref:hypothetical protein n=1 Tax=Roseinatronobacter sp. S2 TaxID=3035471 RepID=UPI002410A8AB|nr:hypothetical protein [Roseinatronobacter sp. S2]WFE74248.1 hypothetical protein P8S53_13810 [Roseinatronobacter sp. S2]